MSLEGEEYIVPFHLCRNMSHPGSLWSWRNAASALFNPLPPRPPVGDRKGGTRDQPS